jgi:hypothetical protein
MGPAEEHATICLGDSERGLSNVLSRLRESPGRWILIAEDRRHPNHFWLSDHLANFTDDHPDAFVFTAPKGGPLRLSSWRRRYWIPAGESAHLAPLRPHDMRHTAVALWIAAGQTRSKSQGVLVTRRSHSRSTVTGTSFPRRTRVSPTDSTRSSLGSRRIGLRMWRRCGVALAESEVPRTNRGQ